jgi:hypothetical protein
MMRVPLRIPTVLAVTLLASAGVAIPLACGHGHAPADAPMASDGECPAFCIPDGTDAGVCPTDPVQCIDPSGNCPAGCRPVG